MANRRMFSLDVINTDAFLDMPVSAQCLYFHLGMRADDDGFISAPKQVMRIATCSQDDMRLLIAKKFIIPFETGVVVIRHWKQHNYIQSDRYRKSIYQEEFKQLSLNGNVYELDTDCIQSVLKSDTECEHVVSDSLPQDRLGKDRLGKDRDNIDYQLIVDKYNSICVSLPKVIKLSNNRKKAIGARLKQYSVEDFEKLFEMAESSSFLKGQNNRNWSADFDWLIKDANMAKVLEGKYNDKKESEKDGENQSWGSTADFYRQAIENWSGSQN